MHVISVLRPIMFDDHETQLSVLTLDELNVHLRLHVHVSIFGYGVSSNEDHPCNRLIAKDHLSVDRIDSTQKPIDHWYTL